MNRLVVLLAIVGCYRPGSEPPCTVSCSALGDCPDGLVCNTANNRCGLTVMGCMPGDAPDGDAPPVVADAQADGGMTDAPLPPCMPTTPFAAEALGQGLWFTPDLDGTPTKAVKLDGVPVFTDGDPTLNSPYTAVFVANADVGYESPRLAPTNQDLFYIRQENAVYALQRARRVSGTWTPTTVLLKDENAAMTIPITGAEQLGAPTATVPRHMLVTVNQQVTEYVEVSLVEWRKVITHTPAFTGITFVGHATLSEDGRRMTFRGQVGSENTAGFYADRANLGQSFTTTATKIPSPPGDSVATPWLSSDCHHFFYTHPTSNQIQHVKYE